MLWRFKAALEETCPGSIVEIDCKKINEKNALFKNVCVH